MIVRLWYFFVRVDEASSGHLPATHSKAFPQLGCCRMPVHQLLEALSQIFAFLASEVFAGNRKVRCAARAAVSSLINDHTHTLRL